MAIKIQTSMKCGGCLTKLQPHLDASSLLSSWRANLDDPRKLLIVEPVPTATDDDIVGLVREHGFEAELIEEREDDSDDAESATSFRLATYRPLFLVVSYVAGASVFVQFIRGYWDWMHAMTMFMGFFFLGFAFFKLLDIPKFADAFATYDIVARRSRLYALAYPWIEVGLGLMFITSTWLIAANFLTAIIMSIGLVGVISAVRKRQAIQCACLGTAFNLPMSAVTIIENSVMILMSIAMLARLYF